MQGQSRAVEGRTDKDIEGREGVEGRELQLTVVLHLFAHVMQAFARVSHVRQRRKATFCVCPLTGGHRRPKDWEEVAKSGKARKRFRKLFLFFFTYIDPNILSLNLSIERWKLHILLEVLGVVDRL